MPSKIAILCLVIFSATPVAAQMEFAVSGGNVSIGINLSLYPELEPVPGYPVYYAPRLQSNYFFYDGLYWIYQGDGWYSSSWYNGPWWYVEPEYVPLYLLRVPVRYYRHPPAYFQGWQRNAPPRWDMHWGHDWARRHQGWDHWNRFSAPAPAPLPLYQRRYAGPRYPGVEQQRALHSQHYRYQPREQVAPPARRQADPAPVLRAMPGPAQTRPADHRGDQRGNLPAAHRESTPAKPQARPPQPEREHSGREFAKPAPQPPRQPQPAHTPGPAQYKAAPARTAGPPAAQEHRRPRPPDRPEGGPKREDAGRDQKHRQGPGQDHGDERDHKR